MKFTSNTECNINTVYCVGLKVRSFTQYQLEHVPQCYVSYQDTGLVCYWWYIASIQLILFFRKFTQDTYLGNNTQTSLSYSPKKKMLQIQDKKFAKSMFSEFAYLWKCRGNGGFRDMKSNLKFPHQFNMSFTPSHLTGFQMNSQFYIKGHRLF